ncbi:helix-turn-helix transcriptional regulator, partial [Streptomyces sp. DSM 44915]
MTTTRTSTRTPASALVIGAHLRTLRRTRHLRLDQVAPHAGISTATLSRIETGTIHTHQRHLPALLHLYQHHHQLDHLTHLLNTPPDTWLTDHTPDHHTRLTACHQQATTHRHYTNHHIPHPLRTPEYNAALTPNAPPPPPTPSPPPTELLLDEAVLHRTRT